MRGCGTILAAALLAPAAARAEPPGELGGEVVVVRRSVGSLVNGPADVVVFLEDAPAAGELPRGPFVVQQVGKAFVPQVLIVPRGATVEFPNRDVYRHNIFSLSPSNPFDLGLYEPGATRSMSFERPGIVALYCNIHPQMLGYVVVVSNPFFARPAADGSFAFRGVPPGKYHLVAWLPFGQLAREAVRVASGQRTQVRLVVRERADATRHNRKDGSPYTAY